MYCTTGEVKSRLPEKVYSQASIFSWLIVYICLGRFLHSLFLPSGCFHFKSLIASCKRRYFEFRTFGQVQSASTQSLARGVFAARSASLDAARKRKRVVTRIAVSYIWDAARHCCVGGIAGVASRSRLLGVVC